MKLVPKFCGLGKTTLRREAYLELWFLGKTGNRKPHFHIFGRYD